MPIWKSPVVHAQHHNMPMDFDPDLGDFLIIPEFDNEVDQNVLASMALPQRKPNYGQWFFQCAELTPSQACRKVPKMYELEVQERAIGQKLLALMLSLLTDGERFSSSKLAADLPRGSSPSGRRLLTYVT